MKQQRVIIGAILVGFLGFLDPVFTVVVIGIIVGVVLLLDGFNFFERNSGQPAQVQTASLSALDKAVLLMFSQNKDVDQIAKETGVSAQVVAEKASLLTSTGFLSGNMLTEKGFDAVKGGTPA